ncbi:MAG: V-type ATP synthase subunit F [Promethearchaeota archaeon]
MADQEIYVIGNDDLVILFGLLGVNGTAIKDESDFLTLFRELTDKPSIGMIIVAFDLSQKLVDFILEFKLNHRKPFVYYLPDIFKPNIELNDAFWNHITKSIKKLIN